MVVRSDLPLGLQAAQIIHAAGESARRSQVLPDGTHAVALHVQGESELAAVAASLEGSGIEFVPIRESDPPFTDQLMAIGIPPRRRTPQLKRLLGRLKTVR